MKALVRNQSGKDFSNAKVLDIPSPETGENQIKVKMCASRVNPADQALFNGFPGLKYKTVQLGGIEGSGTVLEVGSAVKNFKAGDRIFFTKLMSDFGTWAEEIVVEAEFCALIPPKLPLEIAGGMGLNLLTAYEAIQSLDPESGKVILIHGAGGGVGFQAVQLAVARGLKVVATSGLRHKELIHKAGVKRMIDPLEEDFSELFKHHPPNYVLDTLGKEILLNSIRLKPERIVTLIYPDPEQMPKTGIQPSWMVKQGMKMAASKFTKAGKRNQVELIGLVCGANGKGLQEASSIVNKIEYELPEFDFVPLSELAERGMQASDLKKVILLDQ